MAGAAVLLCVLPFYLGAFWLQVGLFSMAAALGAVGLTLLTGTAGQLSLGHAFFLAVGAYGYVWLAGDPGPGLPPLLALVLAVCLSGLVGGLFSPVAGRVRGVYLGVATLALVFLGHHVMLNADSITGGFNGRSVPPMSLGGFTFTASDPQLTVLGVPFGAEERLWYLALILLAVGWFAARNLLNGRPGLALTALRDSETAAAVMGVPVARRRSAAFVVSSMYAGLAGVLLALVFRRIVPDYFGLALSIDYLAMIVIGGLGSVAGAAAGAVFVTALPLLMARYADQLPLVAAPGAAGHAVGPTEASRYLYGAAIVLVLLFAPDGLSGVARRAGAAVRRRRTAPPRTASADVASPASASPASESPASASPAASTPAASASDQRPKERTS
ncbi:branched-chain amino acid ABC transporter permease [Streptomyces avermitilis]|nr:MULTISPECIES: branched-chain amino acid ABC transporter permease [Streptomyces]KUN54288.1 branched-chain amino acid ABC transporter permease [Streptomyces avermitilis]MYT01720.1 branched-chain amino acid ABC transporter permease [Streptomyces sp. SID5469]OOV28233.1 branched-chain amino acid ABC transporter permease [Streptomyces avermitilis]